MKVINGLSSNSCQYVNMVQIICVEVCKHKGYDVWCTIFDDKFMRWRCFHKTWDLTFYLDMSRCENKTTPISQNLSSVKTRKLIKYDDNSWRHSTRGVIVMICRQHNQLPLPSYSHYSFFVLYNFIHIEKDKKVVKHYNKS